MPTKVLRVYHTCIDVTTKQPSELWVVALDSLGPWKIITGYGQERDILNDITFCPWCGERLKVSNGVDRSKRSPGCSTPYLRKHI